MSRKHRKEWFDGTFWEDLYPFLFTEERFAGTADELGKVLALTKPPGKSVLDLCCGPGRFAVALAKDGFKVVGVDKTRFLLDKARASAKAAKAKIEWVDMDMRDFVRAAAFDLVINMWTSFGYFDDKNDDRLVLGNILTSLKPGGVCLFELMGKERLANILLDTSSEELPDGTLLIQRREIFDDWTRVRNEWILIRKGRSKSFKFHHTIYSGQEFRDRLEQAGFTNVKLYGNLDGDPYGPKAIRLIAVAHKPKD